MAGPAVRHRDLFPLPHLLPSKEGPVSHKSRSVQQRILRRRHWSEWANEGISALNDLAGRGAHLEGEPNGGQISCIANISQAYRSIGKPDNEFTPEESLSEILGSSHVYSDEGTVAPYQEELVSFPEVGAVPAPLERGLSTSGCKLLVGSWRGQLLRSAEESASARALSGVSKVFSEQSLIRDPDLYG